MLPTDLLLLLPELSDARIIYDTLSSCHSGCILISCSLPRFCLGDVQGSAIGRSLFQRCCSCLLGTIGETDIQPSGKVLAEAVSFLRWVPVENAHLTAHSDGILNANLSLVP